MLNVLYIPTDKEAVEAALVLQRYCDAKFENGCKDCIHNLGSHESCGLSNELPCDYIIPDRIVKETKEEDGDCCGRVLIAHAGAHCSVATSLQYARENPEAVRVWMLLPKLPWEDEK